MINKNPHYVKLDIPELINTALNFPSTGYLSTTTEKLIYLDIDDKYVHQLFPLIKLHYTEVHKPDYFGEKSIGAHISVIYPEEGMPILNGDLDKTHSFKIKDAFSAELGLKRYYVLTVESDSLLELRKKYGLDNKLTFKDYLIDLHITIGVASINMPA